MHVFFSDDASLNPSEVSTNNFPVECCLEIKKVKNVASVKKKNAWFNVSIGSVQMTEGIF